VGHPLGEACPKGFCRFGLECKGPSPFRCLPGASLATIGEACGSSTADKQCEFGAVCDLSGVCANVPTLDETAGKTMYLHCDSWTTESATGKCIVKEALSCN
jgi:hypothetical protein